MLVDVTHIHPLELLDRVEIYLIFHDQNLSPSQSEKATSIVHFERDEVLLYPSQKAVNVPK